MCQRCQVARSANTTLLGNHRYHILLNMPQYALEGGLLHARIALAKGMHLGDEHEPRYVQRNRITNAYTMALQDFILQGGGIFFVDARVGEDAKSGIHAIHGFASVSYTHLRAHE